VNEEALAHRGLSPQKQTNKHVEQMLNFVKDKSKVFCTSSPCTPNKMSTVFTNKVYSLWNTIIFMAYIA
jgi:hypothetical protein